MDTAESQDRVLGLMLDESTDQSGKKVLLLYLRFCQAGRFVTKFWAALEVNARQRRLSLAGLIGEIDSQRGERPLASALRVWALSHQGLPEG